VDLVLDFGLEVELFEQTRDLVLDVTSFGAPFDNLILDRLLDCPEGVAILHVFEDKLTFFCVGQVHIGC